MSALEKVDCIPSLICTLQVYYKGERAYDPSFKDEHKKTVSVSQSRQVQIKDLRPGTNYAVQVAGATHRKEGAKSEAKVVRTPAKGNSAKQRSRSCDSHRPISRGQGRGRGGGGGGLSGWCLMILCFVRIEVKNLDSESRYGKDEKGSSQAS